MKTLIIIILSVFTLSMNAQSDIKLSALHHEGEIILRWSPMGFDSWENGMNDGYRIIRYTLKENETVLDQQAIDSSKVIVGDNVFPYKVNQWNSFDFQNSELGEVGFALLYSNDFVPSFIPSNFEEVISVHNTNSNRLTFTKMIADQDYEIAKALGLGYIDNNINSVNHYKYDLVNSTTLELIASTVIDIPNIASLKGVKDIKANSGDRKIAIEWNVSGTKNIYTSFNIERSSDGIVFQKVNDVPYVHGDDNNSDISSNLTYYIDSIPNNDELFYYRVIGNSSFGVSGPPSEVVTVKGTPGRMNIVLDIAIPEQEEDHVTIVWGGYTTAQIGQISKIDVYKSADIYDNFEKVNSSPISPDNYSYTDFNPSNEGYYMITLEDINGHYYKSRAVLSQPLDRTPPSVPQNLSGHIDKSGEVNISWEGSSLDIDLSGYRVFRANSRNVKFLDISDYDIPENSFTENLSTEVLTDSVFYKIKSSDIRGNHSNFSEVLALVRPISIPPSSPFLHKVFPHIDGVKFSWEYSTSNNVAYHVLERKPRDRANWDEVIKIETGSPQENELIEVEGEFYNFIDVENLDPIVYKYRLVAADNNGLRSLSNILEVTPFYNNLHGNLYYDTHTINCYQGGSSEELSQQITSINSAIDAINNNGNSGAILAQLFASGLINYNQYATILNGNSGNISNSLQDLSSGLQELGENYICEVFLVYFLKAEKEIEYVELIKDSQNEEPKTIQIIRADNVLLLENNRIGLFDKTVKKDTRYVYQVLVHFRDGTLTPMSEEIEILITP